MNTCLGHNGHTTSQFIKITIYLSEYIVLVEWHGPIKVTSLKQIISYYQVRMKQPGEGDFFLIN